MDEDGNSMEKESKEYTLSLRKHVIEGASDRQAIDRYVIENAMTPSEAMTVLGGNIFPKADLLKRLAYIRTHKELQAIKQVGELRINNDNEVEFEVKKYGDITKYPLGKDDKKEGAVVIWEHPMKNAPYGLYIGGLDPYALDTSDSSPSLGSMFVYKRTNGFEAISDTFVAEYTGRPKTDTEFYEQCRRLAMYYNCKILYENNIKGPYVYFAQKNSLHLLADQPTELIKDILQQSKVQREKGV